jgi:hypothetical protein
MEIYAKPEADPSSPEILVGTARINTTNGRDQSFTLVTNAMHVFLPPEQRVFPNTRKVHTPSYYVTDVVATYKNVAGDIERQMSYTLDPRATDPLQDDLKIGGVLDGKLYVNLVENLMGTRKDFYRSTGKDGMTGLREAIEEIAQIRDIAEEFELPLEIVLASMNGKPLGADGDKMADAVASAVQEAIEVRPQEALLSELQAFVASCRGQASTENPGVQDGLAAMQICEKIKKAVVAC